jgi:hypothetical protein
MKILIFSIVHNKIKMINLYKRLLNEEIKLFFPKIFYFYNFIYFKFHYFNLIKIF